MTTPRKTMKARARRALRAHLLELFDAGLYIPLARLLYELDTRDDDSPERGTQADRATWIVAEGRHAARAEAAIERGVEGGVAGVRRVSAADTEFRKKGAH